MNSGRKDSLLSVLCEEGHFQGGKWARAVRNTRGSMAHTMHMIEAFLSQLPQILAHLHSAH